MENDSTKQPSKSIFRTFLTKRKDRKVSFSTEPEICLQSTENLSRNKFNDQGNQTDSPVKKIKSYAVQQNYQREPHYLESPERTVIQKDHIVNPRVETTYQQHFNNTADLRLGYCDNRSIEERHRCFKESKRRQDDLLQSIKSKSVSNYRRYKSDCRQRISEYMAETSYIGGAIMNSGIHNHSKCPSKHCTHFIKFK